MFETRKRHTQIGLRTSFAPLWRKNDGAANDEPVGVLALKSLCLFQSFWVLGIPWIIDKLEHRAGAGICFFFDVGFEAIQSPPDWIGHFVILRPWVALFPFHRGLSSWSKPADYLCVWVLLPTALSGIGIVNKNNARPRVGLQAF
jgi:hypothetical protein